VKSISASRKTVELVKTDHEYYTKLSGVTLYVDDQYEKTWAE